MQMFNNDQFLYLSFGALTESLHTQLDKQGFKYNKQIIDRCQQEREAILLLRIGGNNLLNDSMHEKIVSKLYRCIVTHVCKYNKIKKV